MKNLLVVDVAALLKFFVGCKWANPVPYRRDLFQGFWRANTACPSRRCLV